LAAEFIGNKPTNR